jgi:hypothetical protein
MPKPKSTTYVPSTTKTLIDLTGQKFGRWIVVERAQSAKDTKWLCLCDCGGKKIVAATSLRRGLSTSCGCVTKKHGAFGTRIYRIWANMLNRCRNKNVPAYKDYGGREITVCEPWSDFIIFNEWATTHGYSDGLTIERNNVNDGYNPGNCQWIKQEFQSANRRGVKRDAFGRPWCDIAREHGVTSRMFNKRVSLGWTEIDAATRPKTR